MKTTTDIHPRDQVFVSERVPGNLKNRTFQLVTSRKQSNKESPLSHSLVLNFSEPVAFKAIAPGDLFIFTVEGATPVFFDVQVYRALDKAEDSRGHGATIRAMRIFHTSILRSIYDACQPQALPVE